MKKAISLVLAAISVLVMFIGCSKINTQINDLEKEISSVNESITALQASKDAIDSVIEQLKNDFEANSDAITALTQQSSILEERISALKTFVETELLTRNDADARYATIEELQKAQADLDTIRDTLDNFSDKKIAAMIMALLNPVTSAIDEQVNSLTGRIEALENMVQSFKLLPAFSDGNIHADDDYMVSATYIITPKAAMDGLASGNFKFLTTTAITKSSGSYSEVEVNVTLNNENGTVTLEADMSEMLNALEAGESLMAAAKLTSGKSEIVTDFVVVSKPAHSSVQLWAGGPRWACANVGAANPWETGYYYSYGNTTGYVLKGETWYIAPGYPGEAMPEANVFSDDFYSKSKGAGLKFGEWSTDAAFLMEYDAARYAWGDSWRTPSKDDIDNLIKNTVQANTENYEGTGVSGCIITGKGDFADRSIFVPFVGRGSYKMEYAGSEGYYRTSNLTEREFTSYVLHVFENIAAKNIDNRYMGAALRPVKD